MLSIVEKFARDNKISCSETIYQVDRVIEHVYEFMDELITAADAFVTEEDEFVEVVDPDWQKRMRHMPLRANMKLDTDCQNCKQNYGVHCGDLCPPGNTSFVPVLDNEKKEEHNGRTTYYAGLDRK